MLKIGITGGIGSGKTTVCQIFELLGVPVFYADDAAKSLMNTDQELIEQLKDTFGTETYIKGVLDRKYLAAIVFNHPKQLEKLNGLVHPAVFRAFDGWVNEHAGAAYLLKEAALLFESGSNKLCNKTIVVTAPLELRIARVVARDQVNPADVETRIRKQLTDDQKLALADFVIQNDENQLVIPQVLKFHELFMTLSASSV